MSNPARSGRPLAGWSITTASPKSLYKGQCLHPSGFLPVVDSSGALEETPFTFNPAKAKEISLNRNQRPTHFTLDVENKPPFITIAQSIPGQAAQGGVKLIAASHLRRVSRWTGLLAFAPTSIRGPFVCGCLIILTLSPISNDASSRQIQHRCRVKRLEIPEPNKETLAVIAEPDSTKRLDLYKKNATRTQRSSQSLLIKAKRKLSCVIMMRGISTGLNADMVWLIRQPKIT